MTVKNLWKLPENVSLERTPTIILSEQAPLLAKMTNELIRAHVSRRAFRSTISTTLRVEAPVLDHYTVDVLEARHHFLSPFPSSVRSGIPEIKEDVESEEELVEVVKRILESEEMQKLLGSLLRESLMQSPGKDSAS